MSPGLIDWKLVGFSALWILGLSVLLATFSFADYAAHVQSARLLDVLKRRDYQLGFYAGLALVALGMTGSSRAWWETAIWILLTTAFAYQILRTWRGRTA